ncbi:unnamed protein product [Fraxinus pennsylvanica]|uniref:Uncharacterized protein n=1 Tax=Fraxinus pennsylvanica TaxID=56036 RepID=A0AAD1ZCT2_9LAMI|nr:unnamed protein product [Fraxinus pennsylvanica]
MGAEAGCFGGHHFITKIFDHLQKAFKDEAVGIRYEVSGDGSFSLTPELSSGEANDNERPSEAPQATPLTMSASFRDRGKSSPRRRAAVRPNLDADEFLNLLHGSDPVMLELNRLENL